MATVHQDETRRYQDAGGVVHRSSDLGLGNRITLCERYMIGMDTYDTRELAPTRHPITCFRCLFIAHKIFGAAS